MGETFEHANMPGTTFHDVNLDGVVFDDVNLRAATFTNVNLDGARIRNANLQDVDIDEANVRGLRVLGFCVGDLIDAELDRRFPERARLRVRDVYDPAQVRACVERLEALRGEFRAKLLAAPADALAAHPAPGEWSAVETVRHMLFAEDLYLNHLILRSGGPFNPHGLLPYHMHDWPGYEGVGREPGGDLREVLEAWDEVHAGTCDYLAALSAEVLRRPAVDTEGRPSPAGLILQNLALHDLEHMGQASRALSTNLHE